MQYLKKAFVGVLWFRVIGKRRVFRTNEAMKNGLFRKLLPPEKKRNFISNRRNVSAMVSNSSILFFEMLLSDLMKRIISAKATATQTVQICMKMMFASVSTVFRIPEEEKK